MVSPRLCFRAAVGAGLLLAARGSILCQKTTSSQPLPTAQQVMDRFVAAQGGHDAIFRHSAMTVRGKFEIPSKNLSLDRVAYYKNGKMLYEIDLPNGGRYQSGYDGATAWEVDPGDGPSLTEGKMVNSVRRDADMHYYGRVLDYFDSMDVTEMTGFAGHTCYHLKGTNKWGILNEHFYDTTTGLLQGYKFNSSWRGGPGDESEVFSGYKDFGGWLMATRIEHISPGGTQVETTESVSFDDVPDSVFVLPDSIKALLAKKGTAGEGTKKSPSSPSN
jgi:hypothetical protein